MHSHYVFENIKNLFCRGGLTTIGLIFNMFQINYSHSHVDSEYPFSVSFVKMGSKVQTLELAKNIKTYKTRRHKDIPLVYTFSKYQCAIPVSFILDGLSSSQQTKLFQFYCVICVDQLSKQTRGGPIMYYIWLWRTQGRGRERRDLKTCTPAKQNKSNKRLQKILFRLHCCQ